MIGGQGNCMVCNECYLLFYRLDGTNFSNYTLITKWCSVFNVIPIVIDLEGKSPRVLDYPPYNFRLLEDAINYTHFNNKKWFWLDHRAEKYWDEVRLPVENVIYCIGHDVTGFQGYRGENMIKVKCVNKKMQDGEWYASMVAPLLLFEVFK